MSYPLSARQADLVQRRNLAVIHLVVITTYSDRQTGAVADTFYFATVPCRYPWEGGSVQRFEALISDLPGYSVGFDHVPGPTDRASGLERALRMSLLNQRDESGAWLVNRLRGENIEFADVTLAELPVDLAGGESMLDLTALAGDEHVYLFRGEITGIGPATLSELSVSAEGKKLQVPRAIITDERNDPRHLGARIPHVIGRGRNLLCYNWLLSRVWGSATETVGTGAENFVVEFKTADFREIPFDDGSDGEFRILLRVGTEAMAAFATLRYNFPTASDVLETNQICFRVVAGERGLFGTGETTHPAGSPVEVFLVETWSVIAHFSKTQVTSAFNLRIEDRHRERTVADLGDFFTLGTTVNTVPTFDYGTETSESVNTWPPGEASSAVLLDRNQTISAIETVNRLDIVERQPSYTAIGSGGSPPVVEAVRYDFDLIDTNPDSDAFSGEWELLSPPRWKTPAPTTPAQEHLRLRFNPISNTNPVSGYGVTIKIKVQELGDFDRMKMRIEWRNMPGRTDATQTISLDGQGETKTVTKGLGSYSGTVGALDGIVVRCVPIIDPGDVTSQQAQWRVQQAYLEVNEQTSPGVPATEIEIEPADPAAIVAEASDMSWQFYIDANGPAVPAGATEYGEDPGEIIVHGADIFRFWLQDIQGLASTDLDQASFDTAWQQLSLGLRHGVALEELGETFPQIAGRLGFDTGIQLTQVERPSGTVYACSHSDLVGGYPAASGDVIDEWQDFTERGREAGTIFTRFRAFYRLDRSKLGDEAWTRLVRADADYSDYDAGFDPVDFAALEAKYGRRDHPGFYLETINGKDRALAWLQKMILEITRDASTYEIAGVPWWLCYGIELGDIRTVDVPWSGPKKCRVIGIDRRFGSDGLTDLIVVEVM